MSRRAGLPVGLKELAEYIGAELRGEGHERGQVDGLASLAQATRRDLSYLADSKYRADLARTQAGAVIVSGEEAGGWTGPVLITRNPRLAFARAAARLFPDERPRAGVHPTAVVDRTAVVAESAEIGALAVVGEGCTIGARVVLGPGCRLEARVTVGDDTRLVAGVTVLRECVIGNRCMLHPGVVVGSDGFGYARDGSAWVKIPQVGRVVIGDDVEVGANTTIDRGALDDTWVGNGVKLDNLIQVAHNVRIGEHTAVAACTGIAGSTRIGARCLIGGGVGIGGHLEIADDVTIMGKTSITNSITQPGMYSSTMSAQPVQDWRKNAVRFRRLDEFVRTLKKLEAEVQRLLSGERRG